MNSNLPGNLKFPAPPTGAKIFFSVGEPSGDLHAAKLIESLQSLGADFQPRGFGGVNMEQAGCHIDFQLTDLAVMGFAEVLPKLREFFRVADIGSQIFADDRPDAVVLVDFPGFNWHIAKRAKQHDIPVFYYLPPQLWAWASWRIKKMKRTVDHVLCNLPFEPEWYAQHGMDVDYVGHPFFDEVLEKQLDASLFHQWQEHDGCQVAVLPGSRSHEVKNIWPMQLEAIRELASRHPSSRFLVGCLREDHKELCQSLLTSADKSIDLHFFVGKTSEIIEIADCALMKSGSVSLEMMARGTPAVVVYHASRAFYTIARRLTDIQSMTLPNMIAKKVIMPEFLAVGRATGETVEKSIAAMSRLIGDRDERILQRHELQRLNNAYGTPGASQRAAAIIAERLGLASSAENSTELHRSAKVAAFAP